jgi:hypothetical protein
VEEFDTIIVLTGESPEQIIRKAGSESWTVDPDRTAKCAFLVCAQNREAGNRFEPTEPHGEAFLVGKIRQVRFQKREKRTSRFMIHLSCYARVSKPRAWRKTGLSRNPVRYTTLQKLGIDAAKLNFKAVPKEIGSTKEGAEQTGGQKRMGRQMEGITGWFSETEPKFDSVPVIITVNDDGSIDLEFEYPGDGKWYVQLSPDAKWNSLTGHGTCPPSRATITWAFFVNNASRRWLLVGEWVQDGRIYKWWTELLEADAVVEAQPNAEAPA